MLCLSYERFLCIFGGKCVRPYRNPTWSSGECAIACGGERSFKCIEATLGHFTPDRQVRGPRGHLCVGRERLYSALRTSGDALPARAKVAMGCVASEPLPQEARRQSSAPRAKSKTLAEEPAIEIVLCGQGESGKSTIFKQMRIIQAQEEGRAGAFDREERKRARQAVFDNIYGQMKLLVRAALAEEMEFDVPASADLARELLADTAEPDSASVGAMLKALWADSALKTTYAERDRLFNLNDGAGYFWDDLDRIYAPDYVPTDADLLRVRVRTQAADAAVFTYRGMPFRVVDLGGQRSERRDWRDALNRANHVLFVSSLCEWDQKLREDLSQSRMTETQNLFTTLMRDPDTAGKGTTVLLNKLDLLRDKLRDAEKQAAFYRHFTDFRGTTPSIHTAVAHISEQFQATARAAKREVRVHAITAVETDSIKVAWRDVRAAVMTQSLQGIL